MKYFGLKMRVIAPLVVVCCLIGVASQVAQAQSPTSGALLTIDSGAGSGITVHAKIYDSQIHSGTVQSASTGSCNATDAIFPTDAFVLEGGSWTGCDRGDALEVTDDNSNAGHQVFGQVDFSGFHIETHYRMQSLVNISAASFTAPNTTTYTYSLSLSRSPNPDLKVGESIVVTGMTNAGNNGTFAITAVVSGTSFTVVNAGGATASGQSGTGTVQVCNTSMTICANPDNGFLTVKNSSTTLAFSGTITLQGNSPTAGDPWCPASVVAGGPGVASDSFTGTLAANGGSVTLALGSQGTVVSITAATAGGTYTYTPVSGPGLLVGQTIFIIGMSDPGNNGTFTITALGSGTFTVTNPNGVNSSGTQTGTGTGAKNADSSNCGGFNAAQTQTLVAGTTSIFPFGNDDYQITPFDSLPGDMLTVLPIPVPAGPLMGTMYGSESGLPALSGARFSATNFPNQDCIAYDDLSALGNPVCLEFQVSCLNGGVNCSDALTYLYTSQIDFTKDHNSLTTIGGTAFLGEHSGSPVGYSGQCPTSGFNLNVFFSYTPTAPDPVTGRGTGSNCYVGTFDPTAAGVPVGQTLTQKTFVGFGKPVVNCTGIFPAPCGNIYFVNKGKSLPLYWQTFSDSAGTVPVTNLNFCGNQSGTGCTTPWVFVGTSEVNCATDIPTAAIQPAAKGASGFRYVGPPLGTFPAGTYTYNVDTGTVTTATGCFTPVLGFSTGFWSFDVAEIEFK